ncbi:MAG: YfhO family protein [Acidobacteria bacterium]|nr:YfhO family protein [Acidobacteriota bacterium]
MKTGDSTEKPAPSPGPVGPGPGGGGPGAAGKRPGDRHGRIGSVPTVVLVTTLCWIQLFLPAFGRGNMLSLTEWTSDSLCMFLPWQDLLRDHLPEGPLCLWNPFNGLGQPHFANLQSAQLFPLTWLRVFLGPGPGSFAESWLKTVLAALSALLLFRKLRLSPGTVLVGSLTWAFLPHFIAFLGWPLGSAEIFIPAALAFTVDYLDRRRFRSVVWLSLTLTLQFFAGQVQTWLPTVMLVLAWFAWFYPWRPLGGRRLADALRFLAFLPLTLALSAPQMLPFLDYLFDSQAFALRTRFNASWSPLSNFAQMLMPAFFGTPAAQNEWGLSGLRVMVMYAGVPALALFGVFVLRKGPRWEKAFYLGGIGVFALFFLRFPPGLTTWLLHLTPLGATGFLKFFPFFNLLILIPAMKALDAWDSAADRRTLGWVSAGMIAAAVAAQAAVLPFTRALDLWAWQAANMLLLAGLLLALALALGRAHRLPRPLLAGLLAALVFVDFLPVNRNFVEHGRVDALLPGLHDVRALLPSPGTGQPYRVFAPDIPPEINLLFGFHSVNGYDALTPARTFRLLAWMDHGLSEGYGTLEPTAESLTVIDRGTLHRWWFKRLFEIYGKGRMASVLAQPRLEPATRMDDRDVARLLAVRFVLSRRPLSDPELRPVSARGPWRLYELPRACPLYAFHPEVRHAGSAREAWNALRADPGLSVERPVVQAAGPPPPASPPPAGEAPPPGPSERSVRVLRRECERVELSVDAPGNGYLVARELYDPDWACTVDGVEQPILPADVAFRAVRVPAGVHRVTFHYAPASLRTGFGLAALAVLTLAVAGTLGRVRRWRRGRPPA